MQGALRAAQAAWKSRRADAPLIATLAVTARCPLRCGHCSEGGGQEEMPALMIERAVDELGSLGCPVVALTGGEPLCRADLPALLSRIPPWTTAMVYTSGVGLTTQTAAAFSRMPNLLVCLSLDHEDPSEHDRRRGFPGAHAAVMRALGLLRDGRCGLHVSSLITRDRLDETALSAFARGLREKGVSCVQFFEPRPAGRLARDARSGLRPEEGLRLGALAREMNKDPRSPWVVAYPALERPGMLGCCGGYSRLHVDASGCVRPCDFAPLSFGSLGEESLSALWKRMRAFFTAPGSRCMVQGNPGLFARERSSRNLDFSSLLDPRSLRSPVPGAWRRCGEQGYRRLAAGLSLAAAADFDS